MDALVSVMGGIFIVIVLFVLVIGVGLVGVERSKKKVLPIEAPQKEEKQSSSIDSIVFGGLGGVIVPILGPVVNFLRIGLGTPTWRNVTSGQNLVASMFITALAAFLGLTWGRIVSIEVFPKRPILSPIAAGIGGIVIGILVAYSLFSLLF